VLVLLAIAQFMVILDMTVVNLALPSIGRALHFAPADLQWVVTAYVLVTGGLTLLGGRASDLLGRRRMFLTGLAVFTAASLASGLAPTAGLLIAARAAQGAGAALLTPAALAIIIATYAGGQRTTALSVWGALAAAGSAVGLLVGGILTTWVGWRSVFLVNVPIGAMAAALAGGLVPKAAAASGVRGRLDLAGALLPVAGVGTAVYAVTGAAQHGWGSARTLLLLALAAALLGLFAAVEHRVRQPLLPLKVLRSRTLVSGALLLLTATGILVGVLFLSSLYLQNILLASPVRAGLEFLPMMLMTGVAAHLASRLMRRAGSRALAVAGLTAMAAGALLLARTSGYVDSLLPGFVLAGAGAGLVFPAASVTAMSSVREGMAGLASGVQTTAHEVGAALGVAVLAAVASATAGFTVAGGGTAAGYRPAFIAAASVAAGLAIITALALPSVRPPSGAKVSMH
jgi:EmrB/QacA subfamily drug resistance transporter